MFTQAQQPQMEPFRKIIQGIAKKSPDCYRGFQMLARESNSAGEFKGPRQIPNIYNL